MNQQLPIAVKEATEIAQKAQSLSDQLKDLALNAQNVGSSVDPFILSVTIFVLACFVGYYVIWKVTPALHTPLMSITNAISGIIIIAAMLASGSTCFSFASLLAYFAVFFASINVFGGFIVTERMLEMFRKNRK